MILRLSTGSGWSRGTLASGAAAGSLVVASLALLATAQPTSTSPLAPNPNGMRRADSTWAALTNATVHPKPGQVLRRATVVVRDGRITDVLPADPGPDGVANTDDDIAPRLPMGPRVYDYSGLHLYAAFVEPYLELDTPKPLASDPGKHWNDAVTPQRSALDGLANLEAQAGALRKLGFASAAISPKGGIFRGRSAVVSLAKPFDDANAAAARPPVYRENAYHSVSFDNDGTGYPGSQMGAIALIRQTLSDADWQAATRKSGECKDAANCLDLLAIGEISPLFLFDCGSELEALRAFKVAAEFHRPAAILGSGSDYKRLAAFREPAMVAGPPRELLLTKGDEVAGINPAITLVPAQVPFILPLNFPAAPDVSSPGKVEQVDLRELMSWEQAPTNPRRFAAEQICFALTTHRLRNRNDFSSNLRRAIAHGLTEDQALAALTTAPAEILNLGGELGQVAAGHRANLVVADGPIFGKNADGKQSKIRDLWVDGQRHELSPPPGPDLEGTWKATIELAGGMSGSGSVVISGDNAITIKVGTKSTKAERVSITPTSISFTFDHAALTGGEAAQVFAASALLSRDATGAVTSFAGVGMDHEGKRFTLAATREPKSPVLGAWRISEADGAAKDPAAKDQLDLTITSDSLTLRFTFDKKDPLTIKADDVVIEGTTITFTHALDKLGMEGKSTDRIVLEGETLVGESTLPDGSKHPYKATRKPKQTKPDDEPTDPALITKDVPQILGLPFGPYAMDEQPAQIDALFKNATVWTNTGEPLQNASVAIKEGKIVFVGTEKQLGDWFQKGVQLRQPWVEFDCTGKHITPGIIDAHSHTGISSGVNEAGRAISSEVRIGDVTNPDDLSWYRQLAGGVTSVLSLHGSANAIGGQSQTNKIRWGVAHPDDMHFEGAKPGIKFALGENPTQMNGGGRNRNRYPITRMGVEMIIRDRFTQAKEYAAGKARSGDLKPVVSEKAVGIDPTVETYPIVRRDLQLEALAEILAGERLIHCHSYRQDEILMLTQVARDFNFKIGTFQHILEGYKVADYVRDYSGGPSGFSDWWAYKIEVQDAIPGGPVLMHEVGNTVSYNSDSDELARRLNVEAAKAIKYSNGRIKPSEALKFVTLNPAKQLMVDDRVGSIEVGKDADLAVWSGEPMSAFSKCERTFVDGREYFSLEQDAKHREKIAAERSRLIQKLLAKPRKAGEKADGDRPTNADDTPVDEGVDSPRPRRRRPPSEEMTSGANVAEAETGTENASGLSSNEIIRRRLLNLQLLNRGINPDEHRPGLCGCGYTH